jgi:glycosyltransferase involved in cell wall biosynthesis
MKKIKILYLGNNLSQKSKYETSISILTNLLIKEKIEVLVFSNKINKILRLSEMCLQLFKNRKHIDFLLVDTFSSSNFYYAYITTKIAKFLSIRYIPILRGGNLPERLDRSPRMSKGIFKYSFENIAPSGYLKYEFEKRSYSTKLIPNVLDVSLYEFRRRTNIQPKLLYVRAFADIYNPLMAIRVLKELKKSYPNAQLCMIGPDRDGSFAGVKQLVSKLDLNDSVEFTGVLEKEKWHEKSKEYDIFINTTNFDNTPISVMEVMALGIPVVSTNAGGLPYLLEDKIDALLVDKNDVIGMVDAISQFLTSQVKVELLTKNARKKVEKFDWKYVKKDWNKLFKNEII